jgi:hypothetical protein
VSPRRHRRGLAYKNRAPRPPRAVTAAPPRPPLPAAGELASPSFSSAPNLPSLLPRCPRNLHRRPLLGIAPPLPEPQPAGAVTARPRRSRPRSNPGFHRALGEHVVMPHRLPGRERGRLASIRPVPPPPMPKAPIARPPFFLGCLLQTRGMVVMFPIFVGSLVQKGIFTGICKWLKLVKSLENRIKFGKLQTQFC